MFSRRFLVRAAASVVGVTLVAGSLAACSAGGSSSSSGSGGKVTISFLTQNDSQSVATGKKYIAAFEKAYPNITVKMDTQPAGTQGDNLTKTKLSTGEMDDVFYYNDGSLLQALDPDKQLVDLSDQSWVKGLTKDFKQVVSTSKGLYGAPVGTSFAGGVLYNKKVYSKLGLSVPTSWAEFMSNSEKIKAQDPSVTPILQTYGDDWTAQLFVLGDFANVAKADPKWASNYTKGKEKYSNQPALAGFQHQQDTKDAGLYNKDFASVTNIQGMKLLADGNAAQYPMLTASLATVAQNEPSELNDIGFFALPADNAADTQATIWQPNAFYIPKTTTGDKLDAAKKFIAYISSSKTGCKLQQSTGVVTGPFVNSACKLSGSVPAAVTDEQKYFDSGATSSALEFLSPIKGPNLPSITVQVGSGISTAKQGAALYDQDVKKQAQQLGLPGW
ncbi:ABC transporter substrate-binding protein [Frondihabitans australicus]|uniref:Carbohydrate ABC transporter substrate-binding protein (CUT1 family) n=1 Tax=Frondihabitans australicus TaxID=386892 RepID=A0A495ID82_9MICO|nr:extracellular solute-binding protein [Frondihabitans australicus]RKR73590.1 carbohydrate ABC transporter substrate-binding protein (CUT1 family) [Frondihabitans australicus]